MKKLSRVFWLILLVAPGSATIPGASPATFVVTIGNYFFRPTNLVINVGDSVLWTNVGSFPHDTTHGTTTTPAGSQFGNAKDLSGLSSSPDRNFDHG